MGVAQVELAVVPHFQSLSEDNLLTEEEPEDEEDEDKKMELAFIEDRKQVEERVSLDQTVIAGTFWSLC